MTEKLHTLAILITTNLGTIQVKLLQLLKLIGVQVFQVL